VVRANYPAGKAFTANAAGLTLTEAGPGCAQIADSAHRPGHRTRHVRVRRREC
jgi:hypothetical protein